MAKTDKDKINLDINKNNISSESSDDDEEESEKSNEDTKNKILKALDEKINQKKEELKQPSTIQQKKEEIFKIAKGLKIDIKNLDVAINEILEKHQNSYLNTFSTFMDTIRKEVTKQLEDKEKKAE